MLWRHRGNNITQLLNYSFTRHTASKQTSLPTIPSNKDFLSLTLLSLDLFRWCSSQLFLAIFQPVIFSWCFHKQSKTAWKLKIWNNIKAFAKHFHLACENISDIVWINIRSWLGDILNICNILFIIMLAVYN